ncbi:MAG: P27 family phage terminase small subunit [Clostridia bacterium]|nr:P27 family phage terminase small subunit [Clostridia bacterium]
MQKDRKHYTKQEISTLLEQAEFESTPFKDICVPSYLSKKQQEIFFDYAYKMLKLGYFSELDEEVLAQLIIAKDQLKEINKKLNAASKGGDIFQIKDLTNIKDKIFKQFCTAANALGLTPTARATVAVKGQRSADDSDEL